MRYYRLLTYLGITFFIFLLYFFDNESLFVLIFFLLSSFFFICTKSKNRFIKIFSTNFFIFILGFLIFEFFLYSKSAYKKLPKLNEVAQSKCKYFVSHDIVSYKKYNILRYPKNTSIENSLTCKNEVIFNAKYSINNNGHRRRDLFTNRF